MTHQSASAAAQDLGRPDAGAAPAAAPERPAVYQIRLQGHLVSQWQDWFDGLTITLEDNGVTLLTGRVIDQAALHGLLKKTRDLGLPLVSVLRVDPGPAAPPEVQA